MEDIDILADEIERLRQCLKEARSHVVRQQFAGKHEQDRIDAVEWIKKYGPSWVRAKRGER
tara:strand:- start:434 stop:616 length:183 start_codon:yes stop_codon:yes gene_type:complete